MELILGLELFAGIIIFALRTYRQHFLNSCIGPCKIALKKIARRCNRFRISLFQLIQFSIRVYLLWIIDLFFLFSMFVYIAATCSFFFFFLPLATYSLKKNLQQFPFFSMALFL